MAEKWMVPRKIGPSLYDTKKSDGYLEVVLARQHDVEIASLRRDVLGEVETLVREMSLSSPDEFDMQQSILSMLDDMKKE